MDNKLPQINPTTPLGTMLSKMLDHSKNNTFTTSNDVKVNHTTQGTTLTLDPSVKNFSTTYSNYKGKWDVSSAFSVNDIVRVETQTEPSSSKGVWICVVDVPDKAISDSLKGQGWSEGSSYVRVDGVNYNPIWPEPTKTAADITSNMTITEKASVRYWELLSLLPVEAHLCVDGVDSIYYIGAIKSGSYTI